MLGSVLIYGGSKKARLEKAWNLLSEYEFKIDAECPDLLVVQKESDKKSVGIVQAKVVKKFLQERPFRKKIKAVVIEDVQLLTVDAQGSLLKVLEEPPTFALIILLCDKEGSLLPTVVSRCQKVVIRSMVPSAVECEGRAGERDPSRAGRPQTRSDYDVAHLSYEEIFDLAKDLSARGKDEAIEFLEKVLHYDIAGGASPLVVYKMEKAIKELKDANIALKFALEYLFLLHKVRV